MSRLLVIGIPFSISGIYVATTTADATISVVPPAQSASVTANPGMSIKELDSDSVGIPSELPPRETPEFSDLESSRKFLVKTARPGGTMAKQGAELAIARLHPEFVMRLAKAISEARRHGLESAGIFSAYRPPGLGVGGFADKYNSLHSYGLAVDIDGIGGPGSATAMLWHQIAAANHVPCPYGAHHRAEWNHCQATSLKIVGAGNPLRATVTADGPKDIDEMFEVGASVIAQHDSLSQVQFALVLKASGAAVTPSTPRTIGDFVFTQKMAGKMPTSHSEKHNNSGNIPRTLRIYSEEQPKRRKYAAHTPRTRPSRHSHQNPQSKTRLTNA